MTHKVLQAVLNTPWDNIQPLVKRLEQLTDQHSAMQELLQPQLQIIIPLIILLKQNLNIVFNFNVMLNKIKRKLMLLLVVLKIFILMILSMIFLKSQKMKKNVKLLHILDANYKLKNMVLKLFNYKI